jgi:2'-5' RNA ligase
MDFLTASYDNCFIMIRMRQRYYIGLQLPTEIRERIAGAQRLIADEKTILTPLEPHITLLPPPALEDTDSSEITTAARKIGDTFLPFSVRLTNSEWFKRQALAIRVNGEIIYRLQKSLLTLLPEDGEPLYYPKPVFSPHVTFAQARRGCSLTDELADKLEAQLGSLLPYEFTAEYLTLFRWIAPRTYAAEKI